MNDPTHPTSTDESHDSVPSSEKPASPTSPPTRVGHIGPVEEDVSRQVLLDASGRINETIPCQGCGYNLRGLTTDSLCPECSTTVANSLKTDLLQCANPDWVQRIGRGLLIVVIALICSIVIPMIVLPVVLGIVAIQSAATGGGAAAQGAVMQLTSTMTIVTAAIMIPIAAVSVWGTWLATTPEKRQLDDQPRISARMLARYCLLIQLVAGPLEAMTSSSSMNAFNFNTVAVVLPPTGLLIAGALSQLVLAVGYVAAFFYLGQLARRLPSVSLSRQARIVAWGLAVAMGLATIFAIVVLTMMPGIVAGAAGGGGGAAAGTAAGTGGGVVPGTGSVAGLILIGVGGCITALPTAVFGIWAIVLLIIITVRIRRTVPRAKELWVKQGGGRSESSVAAQG